MKEYRIFCDCCGKEVTPEQTRMGNWPKGDEYTSIGASWGFWSDRMDGDDFDVIVCSKCWRKMWEQFFPNYKPHDNFASELDCTEEEYETALRTRVAKRLKWMGVDPKTLPEIEVQEE